MLSAESTTTTRCRMRGPTKRGQLLSDDRSAINLSMSGKFCASIRTEATGLSSADEWNEKIGPYLLRTYEPKAEALFLANLG